MVGLMLVALYAAITLLLEVLPEGGLTSGAGVLSAVVLLLGVVLQLSMSRQRGYRAAGGAVSLLGGALSIVAMSAEQPQLVGIGVGLFVAGSCVEMMGGLSRGQRILPGLTIAAALLWFVPTAFTHALLLGAAVLTLISRRGTGELLFPNAPG